MRFKNLTDVLILGAILLTIAGCGAKKSSVPIAYAPIKTQSKPYLFGWQDYDQSVIPVRGGTTKGGKVTLNQSPSKHWIALQQIEKMGIEKDQAAIRALSGDFKASFDFLETIVFNQKRQPSAPYRSWGTERVYIIEDRPGYVNLQHVMVMYFVDKDEKVQGPMVMKHWRQEWEFEPASMHVYIGNNTWETKTLSERERSGKWVQTAYQVDDSPRYSLIGQWAHHPSHSSWSSEKGWRPLPRREFSVRADYQVLDGTNRLTILPTGWVHEQDNLKRVLNQSENTRIGSSFVAREFGVNRYDSLLDFDFSAGDAYWEKTASYWQLVRTEWKEHKASMPKMSLAKTCDGKPAFALFFGLASKVESGQISDQDEIKAHIKQSLNCIINGSQ